ncbi:MAG: response regulator [Eubacterium sp.]|nr:response regulator [Eubacterium sp.]
MKKSSRFILISLIFIAVFIICAFLCLNIYMAHQNTKDIQKIAETYLDGVVAQFNDEIELVNDSYYATETAIISSISKSDLANPKKVKKGLKTGLKEHDLTSCSLLGTDDSITFIAGTQIASIDEQDAFLQRLNNTGQSIASGTDEAGNILMVFAVDAALAIDDNQTSKALLITCTVEQYSNLLGTNDDDKLVYFSVIRNDSTYVISHKENTEDSYYEKILYHDTPVGETAKESVSRLKECIENSEKFSASLTYSDGAETDSVTERRTVCVTPIEDTDWFLVSSLPYGVLDEAIEDLGANRSRATLVALVSIAIVLVIFFGFFFRQQAKQLQLLKKATESEKSARKAAERARFDAEKANKAKSEFLSNMSHDIRTPMNAIMGLTSIARSNTDDPIKMEETLRKISMSGKQLLGLINDILDMSKIESGKLTLRFEVMSLNEEMNTICNIIRPQIKDKNQHFDISINNIVVEKLYCDELRLNQMLLNLLSNAVKFTPEEGHISISITQEPIPDQDKKIRTIFVVKDDGIGMSDEFKKKVFTAFEREDSTRVDKTQGTGLGMAITKYIVDAMGGNIKVESEEGKGTTFTVTLDLERANFDDEDMTLPNWNILIVDDDEELCQSVQTALMEMGVTSDWCLNGSDALLQLQKAREEGKEYFAALIDYRMKPMDGIEIAGCIREQYSKDLPLLLITAYDWSDIEDRARAVGINGFAAKPLFKSTLYHELTALSDGYSLSTDYNHNRYHLRGKRILLAEDYEINAEVATALLEDVGICVEHAWDGQEATKMFEDSKEGYYDAILMDLRMPHMNGFEATEHIRRTHRSDYNLPIIAMTADAFAEDIKKCLSAGMNAHLAKPIDEEELYQTLENFLQKGDSYVNH